MRRKKIYGLKRRRPDSIRNRSIGRVFNYRVGSRPSMYQRFVRLGDLETGDVFRFRGRKSVYRVVFSGFDYVGYENKNGRVFDVGYNQKAYYSQVYRLNGR